MQSAASRISEAAAVFLEEAKGDNGEKVAALLRAAIWPEGPDGVK